MKRYGIGLLAALAWACMVPLACAADAARFLQGYQIADTQLQVLCADMEAEGTFQLSLGGQELPVQVETVASRQLPVTVYCLVDVSGSMNDYQMQTARDTLAAIQEQMGAEDTMVISALGNSMVSSGVLTTAQERGDAIAALTQGIEDTNLYAGIVQSLELLRTDSTYHPKRCLVILSDGEDEQDTGYTREEVAAAVAQAGVPVYTVATLRQNPTEQQKEYAKELGSFARGSAGGMHSSPELDGSSARQVGEKIWQSIQAGTVLTAELSGAAWDTGRDTAVLRVVYTTADAQYEDSLTLYTEDLPAQAPAPDPSAAPAASPEPAPAPAPEAEPLPWLPALCGGLVLAVVAVAMLLLARRRARAKAAQAQPPEAEKAAPEVAAPVPPPAASPVLQPAPAVPTCEVTMTLIRQKGYVFRFLLKEGAVVTIGRDAGAGVHLDERDTQLSGIHCEVQWKDGGLFVRDARSANGSFVNGIPIKGKGWMPIADGETLRAGANEYRVRYRKMP